jgi:ribosomal protein L11 methyltransferase
LTRPTRLVALTVPIDDVEVACARLWGAGAAAIEERPPDDGHQTFVTVLASDDLRSRTRLGELPATWDVTFSDDDSIVSEAWRDHAGVVRVNEHLELRPAWLASSATDATVVAIEPGSAFGLGDHPTTRLSADAAWRLTRPGDRVLDVGCGTGVLAIVSVLRGATSAVAVDVAEAAREATLDNARRNLVADRIVASCTPLDAVEDEFDLVFANILAPTLVTLADDLVRVVADRGRLVISGILADRHDHVLEALSGLDVSSRSFDDGWACVELVKQRRAGR